MGLPLVSFWLVLSISPIFRRIDTSLLAFNKLGLL
jgi:hypothetical protein